jgi:5'-phosphate synthase pdxT subunit
VSVLTRLPGERHLGRAARRARVEASGSEQADGVRVGVLALQGDVLEHVEMLRAAGVGTRAVRSPADLAAIDAIVLPGGESTAISRLLGLSGLMEPLQARIAAGMPVMATCAGLILLSDELDGDELPRPGGLAVRTRRNAYGAQVDSFDTRVAVRGVAGPPMDVSFIRAPRIERVLSDQVEVLAEVEGHPVVVQQGSLLAMAFHPEVVGDARLHALFVRGIVEQHPR